MTLRAIFYAALAFGASYLLAEPLGVAGALAFAWKGAGVALLALWCAVQARDLDGWLITAVMAFGALGDVLLEAVGLTLGAAAFLLGHGVAIVLYLRNRRVDLSPSQRGLAFVLAVATPLIAWLLTRDADVALYAVGLGLMAATAWTSRFPRYRAGIGAVMFVASDLAIFDGISGSSVLGAAIWPLYFTGQALIALGVVQTLAAARSGNTGTRTTPRRR